MSLDPNRTDTDFEFRHIDQVDEFGISVGDYTIVQSDFDSKTEDNLTDINNVKTTLRSTTDGDSGSDNIGRDNTDAYGATVEAALSTLISAGSGSLPADNSLTTPKYQDASVTELKIADTSISNAKMQDDSVGIDELIDESVTGDKILDGSITPDKLTGENITETDSFTLALTESNRFVMCDKATAITVTVPPNSSVEFSIGTDITLCQYNVGVVTISEGAGVTILSRDSNLDIDGQYSGATLRKVGTDTWVLIGALA